MVFHTLIFMIIFSFLTLSTTLEETHCKLNLYIKLMQLTIFGPTISLTEFLHTGTNFLMMLLPPLLYPFLNKGSNVILSTILLLLKFHFSNIQLVQVRNIYLFDLYFCLSSFLQLYLCLSERVGTVVLGILHVWVIFMFF